MTAITFDTHKFVTRLREAGLEEKQAEAISEAFKEAQTQALETGIATHDDINDLRRDMLEMDGVALNQMGCRFGFRSGRRGNHAG
jgi:hypothetical protein